MDNRQTQKYNMAVTTQNILDDNAALIAGKPLIENAKADLDANLDLIDQHRQQQNIVTNPTTTTKEEARTEMAEQGAIITAGISAIAAAAGDTITAGEFDLEETDLYAKSDSAAKTINGTVKDKMIAMSAALIANDYPALMQSEYTNAINLFVELMGKPDQLISNREGFTLALVEDFKTQETILTQLDKAMKRVKKTEPIFYNQFLSGRKTDETGVRHISIRALVKDKVTGAVLPKAKGTLNPGGTIAKSGSTGKLSVFSLGAGVYSLLVELEGYLPKLIENIVVNPTGITDIIIELEK